jgi:serine protease AprX
MASYKIAYDLQARMRSAAVAQPLGVIVRHRQGIFAAHAAAADAGVIHQYRLVSATAMRVPASRIEMLSQDDSVEYIWPDLPVHTCLDVSVPHVRAPQVWAAGLRGDGVKIGLMDTGIDPNHPDFAARIKGMASFVGGDGTDDNGHGTHVAGIAAGSGASSDGRYRGVAPGASLYIAKVLDENGSGSMSGVMAGIEWAVDQGVQVINLSLGGDMPGDGTDALSTLCDQVVRQLGIVICVAAGNSGPDISTIGAPGCARWVITVGAVDDADTMARFSARGPTSDGRFKPDIVFPGAGIISTQASGTTLGRNIAPGYVEMSGTSMATPHATGGAALLLQARPSLRPDEVKRALLAGAVNINDSPNAQGSGRGDLFAAYQRVVQPAPSQPRATTSSWIDSLARVFRGPQ